MKKRRFAAILLLVCLLVSAFPSLAAAHDPRLVDDANLLTSEEQSDLEQKLDTISEELQFEVVIVTTNTLGGKTPTAYAQDYYDYNNYGYGSNHDVSCCSSVWKTGIGRSLPPDTVSRHLRMPDSAGSWIGCWMI